MNVTEKRRSFLINVMYFAVLIGLFFLFFKYAFGICLPLLTALFVAAVLQKPVDYLTKKTVFHWLLLYLQVTHICQTVLACRVHPNCRFCLSVATDYIADAATFPIQQMCLLFSSKTPSSCDKK